MWAARRGPSVRARWTNPGCGLDYATISQGEAVAAAVVPGRYRGLLTTLEQEKDRQSVLHRRPSPGTWSAVEYTAHVADVLDDLAAAIRRVVAVTTPRCGGGSRPAGGRAALLRSRTGSRPWLPSRPACARLAGVLDSVDPGDCGRTGTMEWGERDDLTLARDAVHEGAHHLRDLERGLRAVRGRRFEEEDD